MKKAMFPTPYGDLKFSTPTYIAYAIPANNVFPTPYGDLKFSTSE